MCSILQVIMACGVHMHFRILNFGTAIRDFRVGVIEI
jgi:hypothetical protein